MYFSDSYTILIPVNMLLNNVALATLFISCESILHSKGITELDTK